MFVANFRAFLNHKSFKPPSKEWDSKGTYGALGGVAIGSIGMIAFGLLGLLS